MKMVYAEEYVWKDPCVRGYETWPVRGLDLPLTVIVSQSLHLCSMASYQARKELIFSASNCLKRLWKALPSYRGKKVPLKKYKVENRFKQ